MCMCVTELFTRPDGQQWLSDSGWSSQAHAIVCNVRQWGFICRGFTRQPAAVFAVLCVTGCGGRSFACWRAAFVMLTSRTILKRLYALPNAHVLLPQLCWFHILVEARVQGSSSSSSVELDCNGGDIRAVHSQYSCELWTDRYRYSSYTVWFCSEFSITIRHIIRRIFINKIISRLRAFVLVFLISAYVFQNKFLHK